MSICPATRNCVRMLTADQPSDGHNEWFTRVSARVYLALSSNYYNLYTYPIPNDFNRKHILASGCAPVRTARPPSPATTHTLVNMKSMKGERQAPILKIKLFFYTHIYSRIATRKSRLTMLTRYLFYFCYLSMKELMCEESNRTVRIL